MDSALVAYFSASGVTAKIAKQIAKAVDAEIFEIKPKVAYTQADLDWTNEKSRSTVEMKNKSIRPELAHGEIDVAKFKTVFIGFPIWWYVAPTIVNSFLEAYDFSGKNIVLFATSGGSGFRKTSEELRVSLPDGARLIEWKVLNGKYTDKELADMIDSLEI